MKHVMKVLAIVLSIVCYCLYSKNRRLERELKESKRAEKESYGMFTALKTEYEKTKTSLETANQTISLMQQLAQSNFNKHYSNLERHMSKYLNA